MTRRIALVVNPASGLGRAARIAHQVADRLGADATVEVHEGRSPDESAALLAAVAGACDAVVVLGGDGIVHLAAQALALGDTPLGIVAAGTGNDVADSLGLPAQPLAAADAVVAALDAGSVRRIDLGRTDTDRWWVTVLCAGTDSAITATANRLRWPKGPRRYDVAIAIEVARLRPRRFRIELDGAELDARHRQAPGPPGGEPARRQAGAHRGRRRPRLRRRRADRGAADHHRVPCRCSSRRVAERQRPAAGPPVRPVPRTPASRRGCPTATASSRRPRSPAWTGRRTGSCA